MTTTEPASTIGLDTLAELTAQLRVDSVRSSTSAGSGMDVCLSGSHAGVEIGADGPSQMALEDLAMMRAVHGSTVLYPSDGTSTVALVDAMARTPGISYLRTTRGGYPGLHPGRSPVGRVQAGSFGRKRSGHPRRRRGDAARGAARRRDPAGEGIAAWVIDCYSVKPVDTETLAAAAACKLVGG